jgi:hypothetical protein
LAPRAVRVVDRRKTESLVIAAYEQTLVPKATTFIASYDEATRYRATWQKEVAEGKGAVGGLVKVMHGWLPLLQRDVQGFNSAEYGDNPAVPDDVMEDAGRLHDVVTDFTDPEGKPLAYKDACLVALDAAIAAAHKEWGEADAADKRYQNLLASVRASAEAFDLELQAFRKTLAAEGGRSDVDFQKLRAERAQVADTEDDPNVPPAPAPVPPAPHGTTQPAQ